MNIIDYKIALRNFLVEKRLLNMVASIHRYTHLIFGNPFRQMRRSGKTPLPRTLIFEPTGRCNLNCSMCYLNTRKIAKSGEMDMAAVKRMINKLPSTIKHASITGGEPTLRNDLEQILHFFKRRGISVTLMTNGTKPEMLRKLAANDLIMAVQLSLDGPKEVHNSIRNSQTAYDSFIESLRVLQEYKNVYIFILAVISKENLDQLPSITEFCKKLNVTNLTFEYEKRYDRGCIEQSIAGLNPWASLQEDDFFITESKNALPDYSLDELRRAIERTEQKAKDIGFYNQYLPYSLIKNLNLYYARNLRNKFNIQCRHLLTVRVNPRGDVIPCFGIRKSFGNLLNNSFEKIWNSDEFCKYRKGLLENNLLSICATCHRAESYDFKFGRIN